MKLHYGKLGVDGSSYRITDVSLGNTKPTFYFQIKLPNKTKSHSVARYSHNGWGKPWRNETSKCSPQFIIRNFLLFPESTSPKHSTWQSQKGQRYEMKTTEERNWKCEKWQLVARSGTVSDCLAVSKWNSPAASSNREGQQVKVHTAPYCCVTLQFEFPVALA